MLPYGIAVVQARSKAAVERCQWKGRKEDVDATEQKVRVAKEMYQVQPTRGHLALPQVTFSHWTAVEFEPWFAAKNPRRGEASRPSFL